MSDIVSSIKTDEKGEAIIDLNEIETGDYTVSASFSQTNQYEAQTTSKDYYVFNGYFTRVKINGTVISNSTIITAQFNDNTLLTFSLEYSEDETNWAVKNNWNIIISVNGQTYTVTSSNPTLDLTLLNAAEHTVNINYPGDTNYYSSTYNITYKQTKNTPTLTATDVTYYVDESKEALVTLTTPNGKGIPRIPVNMTKQDNTYTSTTDNDGVARFSASVSNDPLATSTDTTTYTLEEDTKSIGTLTTNKEYLFKIQNQDTYDLIITDIATLTFTGNNIIITDPLLNTYKTYANEDSDKIRLTYHNNVFRVMVNDELIYSHYYTSLSKAVSIEGSCIINLIQLNTLNSGEYVNTAEVTYSFDGDRNLDSADDEEATFYHKELNTTNNLTYLIDGYANDKVPNYWSKYSWTKSLEYGYYSDGVNHDRVNSLQPYVPAGEYVDFVIYNRDLHGCMFYEEVDNLVYPLDWFVTDNNTYSGLNINLIPSATSIGHINTLTLTANLGVKGKTIKLYNNNSLISSGDTGVDGKKTFTISQPNVGNYNYRAYFEGDTSFQEAGSDIIPVTVYDSVTTLSLVSDKSTYTYPEPVVLTADLGISGKTIKVGNNTATTDSEGIATFTLNNVLPNNYTYTARFLGDANYNSCTSNNVQILINKLTTTTTLGDITTYAKYGETLNITGTTTNVPNGTDVIIQPFGVNATVYNNNYSINIDENGYNNSGKYNVYAETQETSTSKTSSSGTKLVKISPSQDTYKTRYRTGTTIYKGQYIVFDVLDSFNDVLNDRQMSEGKVGIHLYAPGVISNVTTSIPSIDDSFEVSFDNNGFAKVKLNYNYSYNISGNPIGNPITINAMFYRTDSEPFSIIPFSGTINYNKATGGSQSYTH